MYDEFAMIYDRFMSDIPYEEWASYIDGVVRANVVASEDKLKLLELGCGSGNLTSYLAKTYDVTGIDISKKMLEMAKGKCIDAKLYEMDMRDMKLDERFDVIVSFCDCMNYMPDKKGLFDTFVESYRLLEDGGVFVFDMKTECYFRYDLDNSTIVEDEDDVYLVWQNCYDSKKKENQYMIDFFVKEKEMYERYREVQSQYAYTIAEVKELLVKAGFEAEVVAEDGQSDGSEDEVRNFFVCRKKR